MTRAEKIMTRKVERDLEVADWMTTSNFWNMQDDEQEFILFDFDGFQKDGRTDQYHAVWAPNVFPADVDFPEELPEAQGKPWDEYETDYQGLFLIRTRRKKFGKRN